MADLKQILFDNNDRPLKDCPKADLLHMAANEKDPAATWDACKEILARRFNYDDYEIPRLRLLQKADDFLALARKVDSSHFYFEGEDAEQKKLEAAESIERTYRSRREMALQQAKQIEAKDEYEGDPEKKISKEELDEFYRETHQKKFDDLLGRYRDGVLMKAQDQGFVTFLEVKADDWREDIAAFKKFRWAAEMTGNETNKTYMDAAQLYHYRVRPTMNLRRLFCDEEGQVINPKQLHKDIQPEYWHQWRKYNRATHKFKWKDDTGVAYDVRQFDPGAD